LIAKKWDLRLWRSTAHRGGEQRDWSSRKSNRKEKPSTSKDAAREKGKKGAGVRKHSIWEVV